MDKNIKILLCTFFFSSIFIIGTFAAESSNLTISPDNYDYGKVTVDEFEDKTFRVKNEGADDIEIRDVKINGLDKTEFDIQDDDCDGETLEENQSCNIELRFEPDEAGEKEAELYVNSDDGFKEAAIEGTAEAKDSAIKLGDDEIEFEDTIEGYISMETLRISNNGDHKFEIEKIDITGSDQDEFKIIDNNDCEDKELDIDDVCMITIEFEPDSEGDKTAQIEFEVDDSDANSVVDIEAKAIAREDGIYISDNKEDVGKVDVGETSDFEIRVENLTSNVYSIDKITIEGSTDFLIEEDLCTDKNIAKNSDKYDDHCEITIEFAPQWGGQKVATLVVENEDNDNSPLKIPLIGEGVGIENTPGEDVEGDTFESYITNLYEFNVVSGYSDGLYHPERKVTRAQMAKFVVNAFELSINQSGTSFSDVNSDHLLFKYIQTLKNLDIIQGYSDGTYGPDDSVTRGQVTKFVVLALEKAGYTVPTTSNNAFSDVVEGYTFFEYINQLADLKVNDENIINGYSNGDFGPDDELTRGQMAKIVWNSMQLLQ